MRILYYRRVGKDNMSMWQRKHIIDELNVHGIEVEEISPTDYNSIDEANHRLLEVIKIVKFDLFMTPFAEDKIYIETLNEIKKTGIPTLLLCFDNLVVPFAHKNIAKHFDLVWLTSQETEYLFKKWGANTIFLPYAANPYNRVSLPHSGIIPRAVFVGTPYGGRKYLLKNVVECGVPLDLFGIVQDKNIMTAFQNDSWKTNLKNLLSFPVGRQLIKGTLKYHVTRDFDFDGLQIRNMDPVPVDEVPDLYAKYAVSISSTSARNTEVLKHNVPIINLRSFEIPMAYGLQVCRFNQELSNYFEDRKEILFYRNEKELKEIADFLQNPSNEQEILIMKKNARIRAEKYHTWYMRFQYVFRYFKLDYRDEDAQET